MGGLSPTGNPAPDHISPLFRTTTEQLIPLYNLHLVANIFLRECEVEEKNVRLRSLNGDRGGGTNVDLHRNSASPRSVYYQPADIDQKIQTWRITRVWSFHAFFFLPQNLEIN